MQLNPKNKKTMHKLQPKHSKLSQEEAEQLLEKYNISLSQLPKIDKKDSALPEDCKIGEIIKVEREDGPYYRVVI